MALQRDVATENYVKGDGSEQNEKMSCQDVRDLLYLYVCQELEPDERDAIEGHLAECPECRTALGEHKRLATGLGGLFKGRKLYYYSVDN